MLSLGCRRFLRVVRPGIDTTHRRKCARCDRYALLLEQVAQPQATLPKNLSTALREISELDNCAPQSLLQLPDPLRSALQAIFRPPRPPLPRFLRSPVYSVAVSYVLVVAMTLAWGNPYTMLQPTLNSVQTSAVEVLDQSNDLLSSWFDSVRAGFSRQSQRALRLGQQITQQVRELERSLVPEKLNGAESKGEQP